MCPETLRGMRVVGESVFSGGVAILAWAIYTQGIPWRGRQTPTPETAEPVRVELNSATKAASREAVRV